jgi:hypothetical protein
MGMMLFQGEKTKIWPNEQIEALQMSCNYTSPYLGVITVLVGVGRYHSSFEK